MRRFNTWNWATRPAGRGYMVCVGDRAFYVHFKLFWWIWATEVHDLEW